MSWYFQVVWVLFSFPCLPQLECEFHEGKEMEWLTPQVPQRLVGTNHENHREHLRLLSADHVEHCWEHAGNALGMRWEHGTCDPCSGPTRCALSSPTSACKEPGHRDSK